MPEKKTTDDEVRISLAAADQTAERQREQMSPDPKLDAKTIAEFSEADDAAAAREAAADPLRSATEHDTIRRDLPDFNNEVFTAWVGRVVKTHYGEDEDPGTGLPQTIQVERVWVSYGDNDDFEDNNEPLGHLTGVKGAQAVPGAVTAWPWPPRHDQRIQITDQREEDREPQPYDGDIVTVLAGMSGRYYYMVDELPFVGVVIANLGILASLDDPPGDPEDKDKYIVLTGTGDWSGQDGKIATWDADAGPAAWVFTDAEDNTEKVAGGIGEFGVVKVRRVILFGDDNDTVDPPALDQGGLQTDEGLFVEYEFVKIIRPDRMHHGYRVGDNVWCHRRGLYIFAEPVRTNFMAHLMPKGPDDEDDPLNNSYWVREIGIGVDYGATDNTGTLTYSDTLPSGIENDPSGSGGEHRRWVLAWNNSEVYWEATAGVNTGTTSHLLTTGRGIPVEVSMVADSSDGELNGPGYVFNAAPPAKMWYQAIDDWSEGDGSQTSFPTVQAVKVRGPSRVGAAIGTLSTPPGSPADWDIYLVGGSPTGAWVGHQNQYATWNDETGIGEVWTFQVPAIVVLARTAHKTGSTPQPMAMTPNIRQWDVFSASVNVNGQIVADGYHDAPLGTIWMVNDGGPGNTARIPPGWNICDGTNGTPDLEDFFIRASGSGYGAGSGVATHGAGTNDHDDHGTVEVEAGTGEVVTNTVDHTSTNNEPPDFALFFIMRVS